MKDLLEVACTVFFAVLAVIACIACYVVVIVATTAPIWVPIILIRWLW